MGIEDLTKFLKTDHRNKNVQALYAEFKTQQYLLTDLVKIIQSIELTFKKDNTAINTKIISATNYLNAYALKKKATTLYIYGNFIEQHTALKEEITKATENIPTYIEAQLNKIHNNAANNEDKEKVNKAIETLRTALTKPNTNNNNPIKSLTDSLVNLDKLLAYVGDSVNLLSVMDTQHTDLGPALTQQ